MDKTNVKIEQFYVKNQILIKTDNYTYFQSYDTVIAKIDTKTGQVYIDKTYWHQYPAGKLFTKTTSKYRCMFLGENITETRKKIESGQYKLVNLN